MPLLAYFVGNLIINHFWILFKIELTLRIDRAYNLARLVER